MSRLTECLPLIPQSEQVPHYHPPGARCLKCCHWGLDDESHPNLRTCRIFMEPRNADWSCADFNKPAEDDD